MTETNITELRPKAKDATGAQRQARYRKKRKPIVTVPAISATPAPVPHPTHPPQKGRDIPTVTAPRNGGAGITVATLTAALSLATVSGGFSIYGMTSIFTGALYPVIGMGAALELGKLSAVAWLGHQRGSASWGLKASLTMLVLVLMTLNAVGAFGFLSKAHIASALAGDLAVAGRSADTDARLSVQAGVVADLDRRIARSTRRSTLPPSADAPGLRWPWPISSARPEPIWLPSTPTKPRRSPPCRSRKPALRASARWLRPISGRSGI
jgi:hypothetical protein